MFFASLYMIGVKKKWFAVYVQHIGNSMVNDKYHFLSYVFWVVR